MITYDEIQAEVFAAAQATIASDISLTPASSAYNMFASQAAVLNEGEAQIDDLQNSWSVNSSIGISMDNNCGFLLNTQRNYINFELTATIVNNDPTVDFSLTTAYEAIYTDISGNYYFSPVLNAPLNIPHGGGSVSITMIYIGITFSGLPTFPSGTVLTNTSSHDLTVTTSSTFSPVLQDDESYRLRLQTVYAVKGYGTLNSLVYGIKNIPYINSSQVYLGVNSTVTTIVGKNNNYSLPYGNILVIIDCPFINNASVQQAIGLTISNLKDVLNVTYSNMTPFPNEIDITVPLVNGQTVPITFYTAIPNNINISLTIQSQFPIFNDTDLTNLFNLVNTYVQNQGIGGSFYFSDICVILSNYAKNTLNVKTMSVTSGSTTTPNVLIYTQAADQKFFLNQLNFVYSPS